MGLNCGVDIVEINRIKRAFAARKEAFVKKVYTENEINYCERKKGGCFQSYAARFAAKEAVSKALGKGFVEGIALKEIEVLNDELGKPYIKLHGRAKETFDVMGGKDLSISLSHCKSYAVAYCILQSDQVPRVYINEEV